MGAAEGFLDQFVETAEHAMSRLASLLKLHINDYVDLETTRGNCLVAKDASMATILRYEGFRSLIGKGDFKRFIENFANGMEPFLGHSGHQIQIVYYRDDDPDDQVMKLLQPSYDTCKTLELDLIDVLDEKRAIHREKCMTEETFLVLWTRPSILDPAEVRLSKQETREMIQKYGLPAMANAQNIFRPIRFLVDRHQAYVNSVKSLILSLNGSVQEVEIHEAFCEMKRIIYRDSTPRTWRPTLVGDPIIALWKKNKKRNDISEIAYPRLDDQFFSSPAAHGTKKRTKEGELSDTRAVRFGNRVFAPVLVKVPPQRPTAFSALFREMNNPAPNAKGTLSKPIPWSISFTLEGDGLKAIQLRKFFAGLMGPLSQGNRDLSAAGNALAHYKESGGAVIKLQVTAMTWAPYGEESELMLRRSNLSSQLKKWGNLTTEEETGEAVEAVLSCVPGLRLQQIARESAPPLHDAAYMLPFGRPASPFFHGQTPYRTLDGKIMPWETFSDQQNTWITLLFGGPGSGKSVEANRRNEEMCLMGGNKRLPFVGVIDVGVSSSGYVMLVKDGLPEDKKHLAVYARIQNTEKYRVNQFDTQLGNRHPTPREREYMRNWLVALLTPPERGRCHTYMPEFIGRVIDEAFRRCSDQYEKGSPKDFAPNVNPWLLERVKTAGIMFKEATKWWQIVDAFFERGMYYEAAVAQRYAVPTLFDIMQVGSDSAVQQDFEGALDAGMGVYQEFRIMIQAAANDYPVFNGVTMFDIGESRVTAIDLQDVVSEGSRAAQKQATLMYMMAANAILRKVNLCEEELDSINPKYRAYHRRRVEELREDFKRLFIDEYHKTGNSPQFQEALLVYGRESRKWGLEIVLASQLPEDFRDLAKLATTILIMDKGNEQTRSTIRDVFGLTETEVAALQNFVHGPQRGIGTTFLAKIKTKDADLSQLFTSTLGGIELWALATTMEDRALRALLYNQLPSAEARKALKERFPKGSCKEFVDLQKKMARDELGEGFVDDEVTDSVIQSLAKELIYGWREKSALAPA